MHIHLNPVDDVCKKNESKKVINIGKGRNDSYHTHSLIVVWILEPLQRIHNTFQCEKKKPSEIEERARKTR